MEKLVADRMKEHAGGMWGAKMVMGGDMSEGSATVEYWNRLLSMLPTATLVAALLRLTAGGGAEIKLLKVLL